MSSATSIKQKSEANAPDAQAAAERTSIRGRWPWLLIVPAGSALVAATGLLGFAGAKWGAAVGFLIAGAGAFGLVALQIWKAVAAAVAAPGAEELARAGSRRRRELEREKTLVLKALKELEFDHQMGKISDAGFAEAQEVYRARAIRILKQLDAGAAGYRELIERELRGRLGRAEIAPQGDSPKEAAGGRVCGCGVANDGDAVFCKKCGARLVAAEPEPES